MLFSSLIELNDQSSYINEIIHKRRNKPKDYVSSIQIDNKKESDDKKYREHGRVIVEQKIAEKMNSINNLTPQAPKKYYKSNAYQEDYSTINPRKINDNAYQEDYSTINPRKINERGFYKKQNQDLISLNEFDQFDCTSSRLDTQTATFANAHKYSKSNASQVGHNISPQKYTPNRYINQLKMSPDHHSENFESFNKSISILNATDTMKHTNVTTNHNKLHLLRSNCTNTSRTSISNNTGLKKYKDNMELISTSQFNRSTMMVDDLVDQSSYNLLDKHIVNIEKDIEGLAVIFNDKLLKKKVFKAFKVFFNEFTSNLMKADVLLSL